MQSQNDSDTPKAPPLRVNLAQERIGWRKHRPLLLKIRNIGENIGLGILLVICIPFLPIIGSVYLFRKCQEYRHESAEKNGILPNVLSASQNTTVYLSSHDVSDLWGKTDIEYSQSSEKASFNYQNGKGRYKVYGTRQEGLFMLVPMHSKIDPEKCKEDSYYRCDVVRVNGGYNHGDFGETTPMGSNDCVVLICRKALRFLPFKGLMVITADDRTAPITLKRPAGGLSW